MCTKTVVRFVVAQLQIAFSKLFLGDCSTCLSLNVLNLENTPFSYNSTRASVRSELDRFFGGDHGQ